MTSSEELWMANLEALGQWTDALRTKDAKKIADAQARMDKTADAYIANRLRSPVRRSPEIGKEWRDLSKLNTRTSE